MRIGKKNQPYYRIVVAEAKSKRNGRVVETIGNYNPIPKPTLVKLNKDRFLYWLNHGAQPTETVRFLAKKA